MASAHEQVNITPMKQVVTFLTIREHDVSNGPAWDHADSGSAAPADETVAESARRFSALSERRSSSPLLHVIDRGSRHAGLFHGSEFRELNIVLYIIGLTNARPIADTSEPDSWWHIVMGLFK